MGNDLVIPPPVTPGSWKLLLEAALPRKQYVAFGKMLASMDMHLQWAIGKWWLKGEREYGGGRALAEEMGFNYGTVTTYASVARKSSIRIENLSFAHHQIVAALPAPEQETLLREADANDWTVRDLRAALVKHKRRRKHEELSGISLDEHLKGRYRLVYCDPPWRFETHSVLGGEMTSPDNHYETMTVEEICDLIVDGRTMWEVADDDCALYLWTTAPLFMRMQEVLPRWDFEYKTHAMWDKEIPGTGYVFRGQHEILIYATRGNMPAPLFAPPSVFRYKRGKHSAKPPEIRQTLEKMYPMFGKNQRLEMFARGEVPGWTVWGKEAEQSPATLEAAPEAQSGAPGDNVKALLMGQLEKQHKRYRMNRAFRYRARQTAKGAPQ